MSIPSLYNSGDDEEELFRLTNPDNHPDAADESAARKEEEALAGSSYDDAQEKLDETDGASSLAAALPGLTNGELAEVAELIEAIRNRREQKG